jgi:hypothetical protein
MRVYMTLQLLLVIGLLSLPASPLQTLLFEEGHTLGLLFYLGTLVAANLLYFAVRRNPGFVSFEVLHHRPVEETEVAEDPDFIGDDPKLRGSLRMKELKENFLEPYYHMGSRQDTRPRRSSQDSAGSAEEEAGEEEQEAGQFDSAETFKEM